MFANLLGHDAIAERFRRMIARGRLASTFLFVGPEGVGKRSFALGLGQALLCSRSENAELEACGTCDNCQLVRAGNHPDLLTVACPAGKSSLPLELFIGPPEKRGQMGLCHDLSLRPYMGSRRIAVIDDADLLGVECANALLKTLEEPPPRSVLILIGTSLAKQLPTIRSRAQVVRFGALSTADVLSIAQAQRPETPAAELAVLAERSGGALSRLALAADEAWWSFRTQLIAYLSAGRRDAHKFAGLVEDFVNESGKDASERRERMGQVLAGALEFFRDRVRGAAADPLSAEPLLANIDHCFEAEQALGRNVNLANLIPHWVGQLR